MKNKGLCDATQVHLVDPSHRDGLLPDIILMQLKMKSESEEKVRFGGNATRTCAGSVWSAHKGGRNNMEWQLCDSLRMEERLETNIVRETMHHLSFVAFIHNLHTHQRTLWEVVEVILLLVQFGLIHLVASIETLLPKRPCINYS